MIQAVNKAKSDGINYYYNILKTQLYHIVTKDIRLPNQS